MRLAQFTSSGPEIRIGAVLGETVVDLSAAGRHFGKNEPYPGSVLELLRAGEPALANVRMLLAQSPLEKFTLPLSRIRLQAPIARPGKVVAIGLNYLDHCVEQGIDPPSIPLIFAKFPTSITGPYDPIVLPDVDIQADYEAELGVVIGRTASRVQIEDAMDYVAGYLVLNDVSARKWQFSDKQWVRGKSCDTFCPIGPWLTTKDEVPDPHALPISTRVNGRLLQNSNTTNLIFQIPELIRFITASITLEPGDIIATGTPVGVGCFRNPPIYLQAGDVVEIEIGQLGKLRNVVTQFS